MSAFAMELLSGDPDPRTVELEALSDEQLRRLPLMNGWDPGIAGLDPRPMLLAAARNRYGDRIHVSQVPKVKV